jgi:hypothetical protein
VNNPDDARAKAGQPPRYATFGPIDVSSALIKLQATSALNATSTAKLLFDFSGVSEIPDYFGELSVGVIYAGKASPVFTGSVTDAVPYGDGVHVDAMGVVQLEEHITAQMVVGGVSAPEMIYVLARGSGIRPEKLRIDGLEDLPQEEFEVAVPVDDIAVSHPVVFAGVHYLPADYDAIGDFPVNDALRGAFASPAYARVVIKATRILEAEQKGLEKIDISLAWLATQLRCGLAFLPIRGVVAFARRESLSRPARRGLVSVRGRSTGRRWIRDPEMAIQERSVQLDASIRPLDDTIPGLTLQDELALLALGRATREPDLLAQIHALWEAIEFYCSGVSVDPLFTTAQKELIVKSLPELEPNQRRRALDVLGQLNSAPLVVRLRQAIQDDAVPLADGEISLLQRLRKLRNDVVHGRDSQLPAVEDVQYATSLVARLLVYRIARLSGESD